jgi:DNA-directed RNA polymerase subunit omega
MEVPQGVDSKFRLILVAAKRARQLQSGAKPLVQAPSRKATKVAQLELGAGLVPFEVPQPFADDDSASKRKK